MDRDKYRPAPLPEGISVEAVRRQISRILASAAFANAGRMSRFLSFSVEETLGGRAAGLKEYALGVAVFDRPSGFDPRTEPIVRVEARRLRSKLEAYYQSEGAADELIVDLPKGGYGLKFRRKGAIEEPAKTESIRLAVLPFTAHAEEHDYFAEGLSEELIHLLTKVPGIEVIAWGSSTKLRGPEDLERASQHLHLSHYLRGSVRRSASQLKIMAQLLDARDGRYLWSEVFERGLGDLQAIEEEIAAAIAQKFRISFQASGALSAVEPGSEEHNLYMMGRFHANKRTIEGLESSLRCYEQAITIRPTYALAYAGLAESHNLLMDYGGRHPLQTLELVRAAAEKATQQTCPTASAAGYTSLAMIAASHDWNWSESERLYRRAIALDPNYATAHHWFAVDLLSPLGRFEEARTELEIARRLNPLSAIIAEGRVLQLLLQRRYDEALQETKGVLELDPNFYMAHSDMGRILALTGRYKDAVDKYEQARRLSRLLTPKVEGGYAQALALAGRREEARAILGRLTEMAKIRYVPATALAVIELGLGNIDASLTHLEAAVENRESSACMYGIHPLYDRLRSHPRFQAVLERMNLLTVSNKP
jgi:TolB-like protein/Flp pilus assembly protein TadD